MPNQRKRVLSFLLISSLLFGLMAPALATEAKNASLYLNILNYDDPASDDRKQPNSVASLRDALYILTQGTLEKWTPDMAEPQVVEKNVRTDPYGYSDSEEDTAKEGLLVTNLFSDGSFLYGLDLYSGTVQKLTDETGAYKPTLLCTLDCTAFQQPGGDSGADGDAQDYSTPSVLDVDVMDGTLYMVAINYNRGTYIPEIFRWEFVSGKAESPISGTMVQGLAPYKDGKMLCILFDDENSWDADKQQVTPSHLGTFDPSAGKAEPLFELTTHYNYGLCYLPEIDTVYYASDAKVFSLPGVQLPGKISAYFPSQGWGGSGSSFGLLGSSMYFQASYEGVLIRGLDMPGLEDGALTIYGYYNNRAHNAFVAAHPEIPVTLSGSYFETLEAFTGAMVSGENTLDVLGMDTDYSPLTRLIDKGYALDLSGNEKLVALVDSMYPTLADACKKDGKLYAVPLSIRGNAFALNKDVWEELEIPEEDIPTTIPHLLDFVSNWTLDYGEDNPDYKLFENSDVPDLLLRYVMQSYVSYSARQGTPLDFDTELFRKLMQALDAIDFSEWEDAREAETDEDFWNRRALFTEYVSPFYFPYGETNLPMLLGLDEGLTPVLPASLEVMIINPRSTRTSAAMTYLEETSASYESQSDNITLFPGHNDPVPNLRFEADLKEYTKMLEDGKARLAVADAENKASVQSEVDYLTELVSHSEGRRFLVPAEQIAYYRENIAPYLCVTGQTPLTTWDKDGNNELYTLMQQYLQKAISSDQFIKEASKRVRMMALEDQ